MKKVGLICAVALAGMSLAACGNQSSKESSSSSKASSSKVVKSHKKQNKKKQSSSSSASSTSSSKSQQGQNSTTPSQTQQNNPQAANNGQINNAQDALNAAKAKYGNGNGNYQWTIMYDAGTGQPIRNADGSYFVKAIDPTQGTMTGTAQSVNVYPDGSMTNN